MFNEIINLVQVLAVFHLSLKTYFQWRKKEINQELKLRCLRQSVQVFSVPCISIRADRKYAETSMKLFSIEGLIMMLNAEICIHGKNCFELCIGMDAGRNTDNFAHGCSLFKRFINLK